MGKISKSLVTFTALTILLGFGETRSAAQPSTNELIDRFLALHKKLSTHRDRVEIVQQILDQEREIAQTLLERATVKMSFEPDVHTLSYQQVLDRSDAVPLGVQVGAAITYSYDLVVGLAGMEDTTPKWLTLSPENLDLVRAIRSDPRFEERLEVTQEGNGLTLRWSPQGYERFVSDRYASIATDRSWIDLFRWTALRELARNWSEIHRGYLGNTRSNFTVSDVCRARFPLLQHTLALSGSEEVKKTWESEVRRRIARDIAQLLSQENLPSFLSESKRASGIQIRRLKKDEWEERLLQQLRSMPVQWFDGNEVDQVSWIARAVAEVIGTQYAVAWAASLREENEDLTPIPAATQVEMAKELGGAEERYSKIIEQRYRSSIVSALSEARSFRVESLAEEKTKALTELVLNTTREILTWTRRGNDTDVAHAAAIRILAAKLGSVPQSVIDFVSTVEEVRLDLYSRGIEVIPLSIDVARQLYQKTQEGMDEEFQVWAGALTWDRTAPFDLGDIFPDEELRRRYYRAAIDQVARALPIMTVAIPATGGRQLWQIAREIVGAPPRSGGTANVGDRRLISGGPRRMREQTEREEALRWEGENSSIDLDRLRSLVRVGLAEAAVQSQKAMDPICSEDRPAKLRYLFGDRRLYSKLLEGHPGIAPYSEEASVRLLTPTWTETVIDGVAPSAVGLFFVSLMGIAAADELFGTHVGGWLAMMKLPSMFMMWGSAAALPLVIGGFARDVELGFDLERVADQLDALSHSDPLREVVGDIAIAMEARKASDRHWNHLWALRLPMDGLFAYQGVRHIGPLLLALAQGRALLRAYRTLGLPIGEEGRLPPFEEVSRAYSLRSRRDAAATRAYERLRDRLYYPSP